MVAEPFVKKNIFGAFPDHYRIAYTHNGWANILLEQFYEEIDELVPWKSLFLQAYAGPLFAVPIRVLGERVAGISSGFSNLWMFNRQTGQCVQLETAEGKVMTINEVTHPKCR